MQEGAAPPPHNLSHGFPAESPAQPIFLGLGPLGQDRHDHCLKIAGQPVVSDILESEDGSQQPGGKLRLPALLDQLSLASLPACHGSFPCDGCPLPDGQAPRPGGAADLPSQAAQGNGVGVFPHGRR